MTIPPGRYALGPDDATLTVRTGKAGAAAKAGHNLRIEVTSWQATLELANDPGQTALALTADARSLRVRDGSDPTQIKTIEDIALYAHGTGPLPPGVEGGLDAQTVYRD